MPDLSLDWVETTAGQFNDVLIVNKEWVFRFPRYRDGVRRLEAETSILKALRGRLPLAIPNPVHQILEPPVPGLAFMGYPRLPGEPFTQKWLEGIRDEFVRDDLARQLAGFLRALHSLPLMELPARFPGVIAGDVADGRTEWERMYADIRKKLFPNMRPDAREQVAIHFETYLDDPGLYRFTPCLRHGDFGGPNILWDPEKVRIIAVIDFAFCAPGDPAYDLASISTLGEDFFQRLVQRYEFDTANIPGLLARVRFYRGTFALSEALDGLRYNDPVAYQNGMEAYI